MPASFAYTSNPILFLEEGRDEAEVDVDDEDLPAENVVISQKLPILPPGYYVSEEQLAYNEQWDETTELQSDS